MILVAGTSATQRSAPDFSFDADPNSGGFGLRQHTLPGPKWLARLRRDERFFALTGWNRELGWTLCPKLGV
jgi:hypothetical protein